MPQSSKGAPNLFQLIRSAWRVNDIRKKMVYTFLMLLLYRLVGSIPVPGINLEAVRDTVQQFDLLGFMNMMTGGSLSQMTIMAMGITPYINASIIMQLLTVAIPALERMQKEGGDEGRKKIAQISRYVTVVLAFIQAVGLVIGMRAATNGTWYNYIVIGLSMTAGTALAMWIGERITENGIGNGISLLIFAGIVANLANWITTYLQNLFTDPQAWWLQGLIMIIFFLIMIVAVTFVDRGERRIMVNYAKRVRGNKMYGGNSTHIPMKVNSTGVLPLIFAYSILQFPGTILAFWPQSAGATWWSSFSAGPWYQLLLALLIFGFTYFYTSISFNPREMAKNLAQNGGVIPGIRPSDPRTGKGPTADFLARVSTRLTLFGALFLAVLATIPTIITGLSGMNLPFAASSLLIAVSVSLETTRQLEMEMKQRHYKGFL